MSKLDITSKIEQLEAFEERLNAGLKSLAAFLDAEDEDYISVDVFGEIFAIKGAQLSEDISICIAIYDANDRVIGTSSSTIYADDFYGLENFSETIYIPASNISKVRVYPKKG